MGAEVPDEERYEEMEADYTEIDLGQQAGILGYSIAEMKASKCAFLHKTIVAVSSL